ncbi:MAG: phosphotransferase [Aggregatilineales bacterium]
MTNDERKAPPAAQGMRQNWTDIPQKIRDLIEAQLGTQVVNAETQSGGFSPGVAARIYTADHQCVFLKAIGTELNPTAVSFHRREARINAQLPENAFAPKLLWSFDDAEDTGWVVLLFDNIEGSNPQTPWQENDLQRVMQAMSQLSSTLTPSPIASDSIPSSSDYFTTRIYGWQKIKTGDPKYFDRLDEWSKRHFDALCELEKNAPNAVAGNTLVHFDVRADNIVMTEDVVWFVDWPHASIGAEWLDVILFAPSVAMQGGLLPEDLLQLNPACQRADPDALTAAIVSMTGMLTFNGMLPPPPGLPTLREFQAAQGEVSRQWIAQRTGWE